MIRLERANVKYKNAFIKAVKEMQAYNDPTSSCKWYKELDIEYLQNNFEAYTQKIRKQEQGEGLPEGWVPATFFWIMNDNDEYVGRIMLRHRLSPYLERIGGHIGYDIISSERRKGYAAKALELCLKEAKAMGLEKVMVSCDEDNIGSKKAIEKNGGIYSDKAIDDGQTVFTLKYWITL